MKTVSQIFSQQTLVDQAWLMSKSSCTGINGTSVEQLRIALDEVGYADAIVNSLSKGSYRPAKLILHRIPKADSKFRLIYVPTVQDRMVQRAVVKYLEPQMEGRFHLNSFGYRPGRSSQHAVLQAQKFIQDGFTHCLKLDVENFFGNIERVRLHKLLRDQYDISPDLRELISAFTKVKAVDGGRVVNPSGVPAGLPIAPLLANIYLTPLDRHLDRIRVRFVRYADDIALFFKSDLERSKFLSDFSETCERQFGIKLNRQKIKLMQPGSLSILGFQFDEYGRITFGPEVIERVTELLMDILTHSPNHPLLANQGSLPARVKGLLSGALSRYRIVHDFEDFCAQLEPLIRIAREHVCQNYSAIEICSTFNDVLQLDEVLFADLDECLGRVISPVDSYRVLRNMRGEELGV